jgi:hypothetical protein
LNTLIFKFLQRRWEDKRLQMEWKEASKNCRKA